MSDVSTSTEKLEAELSELSERLETGKARFQKVREELRWRRESRDEQPPPVEMTADQRHQEELDKLHNEVLVLTNKGIAMETEQAKLVVEAEIFKALRLEAEEKLALVVKHNAVVPNALVDELVAALDDVPPEAGKSIPALLWIVRLRDAATAIVEARVVVKSWKMDGQAIDAIAEARR